MTAPGDENEPEVADISEDELEEIVGGTGAISRDGMPAGRPMIVPYGTRAIAEYSTSPSNFYGSRP